MLFMNDFVEAETEHMHDFLDAISVRTEIVPSSPRALTEPRLEAPFPWAALAKLLRMVVKLPPFRCLARDGQAAVSPSSPCG